MITLLKKYWSLLFLIVIFLFYSFPFFFQGKIPFPSSYIANNIAPWNKYLLPGPIKNGIPDVPGEIFPMRSLVVDVWKSWQVPLWNPYVFSGSPLLANFQSAVFFPGNLLFLLLAKVDAWSILVLLQPILAGLFVYLLGRSLKLAKIASIFSAVSFMFCGYLTVWGAYATMGYAILFLPLVLYLVEKYLQSGNKIILPFIPLALAVSFFAGHIQSWVYVFLATLIYVLVRFFSLEYKNYKLLLLSLLFIFLTIPFVAIKLLPSFEFYNFSGRVLLKIDPKNVGIPLVYLLTLLAPDFFGNPVTRNDWFGTYAEWSGYMGLIPLIFAVLSLTFFKKEKRTWPFLLIGIVGFFLSIKTPILSFISSLPIPILSNSNPARAIVLLSFSLSILSGFGIEQIINNWEKVKKRLLRIMICVTVTFIFLLVLSFLGKFLFTPPVSANLRMISLRNLILPIVLLLFVWFMYFGVRFKPAWKKFLVLSLLFLVGFEMLRFYKKWMPFDAKSLFYSKTTVVDFIKKQPGYYRFYGQFNQTVAYINKLYTINGYEPLNLLSYAQLLGGAGDGNPRRDYQLEVNLQSQEKDTRRLLDILGVKYLVYDAGDPKSPFVFPVWEYPEKDFSKIFDDGKFLIFENKNTFSRPKLYASYQIIPDDKKALQTLLSENFDYQNTLVLNSNPGYAGETLGTGNAFIKSDTAQKMEIETNTLKPSLLFLNDNYYPGWQAYINGKKTKILIADFTFRAVVVPTGKNMVTFRYEPDSFKYGAIVSGITVIFLIMFFVKRKKL